MTHPKKSPSRFGNGSKSQVRLQWEICCLVIIALFGFVPLLFLNSKKTSWISLMFFDVFWPSLFFGGVAFAHAQERCHVLSITAMYGLQDHLREFLSCVWQSSLQTSKYLKSLKSTTTWTEEYHTKFRFVQVGIGLLLMKLVSQNWHDTWHAR